ncbi:hypothetical protein [Microvirga arabica]|uniref:hypothetical protein n=1 Tax=Microvirga arabica TaxID=1128671 RepID=UPI00193A4F0B|nr:hypothetical protein [Microvirga arabica]MBM1170117.1 hypothetical protein [Microvirga arabica]
MNASNGSVMTKSSRVPQPFSRLRRGGRRTWIALAAILLVGGAALNWGWLVAAGIAPLLLALAPCAAMCAVGLCMKGGNACKSESNGAVPVRAANAGQGGAEPA